MTKMESHPSTLDGSLRGAGGAFTYAPSPTQLAAASDAAAHDSTP